MDIVDFPDVDYTKKLVKHAIYVLLFPFLVSVGMGFRMAFNGIANPLWGFITTFLLLSPFSLILILTAIYQRKFYITKIRYSGGIIDIWFYEFGKMKHAALEADKAEAIVEVPMFSRFENYVLIFKNNNQVVARQYTESDWAIDTFKKVNGQLLTIPGLKLNSVLSSVRNNVPTLLKIYAFVCGALAVFYCMINKTAFKRDFNYFDYFIITSLILAAVILIVRARKIETRN